MKKQIVPHGLGKKKEEEEEEEKAVHGDTPLLPDELITDILKRLSAKSLIRFQCVSKHWKSLMKSPSFVADHLHHPSNQNPSLLFQQRGGADANPVNLFVADCKINGPLDLEELPSMSDYHHRASIIGTCNGLICVRLLTCSPLGSSLFLWNPATREVRRVPGSSNDDHDHDGFFHYGFGYSPLANDYKIVKICGTYFLKNKKRFVPINSTIHLGHGSNCWQGRNRKDCVQGSNWQERKTKDFVYRRKKACLLQVYSLRTDSWREIESKNIWGVKFYFFGNTSANGSIYWDVINISNRQEQILSFDLAEEVFIWRPCPLDMNPSTVINIFACDKKVALFCVRELLPEFWVMEEGLDASGAKEWIWRKIDNINPNFSHLDSKVASRWKANGVDYTLLYVESLAPISYIDGEEPRN